MPVEPLSCLSAGAAEYAPDGCRVGGSGVIPDVEDNIMDAICIETIRRRLLRNAYLFDVPPTYVAGVEDALAEVERRLATPVIDLDRVPDGPAAKLRIPG